MAKMAAAPSMAAIMAWRHQNENENGGKHQASRQRKMALMAWQNESEAKKNNERKKMKMAKKMKKMA